MNLKASREAMATLVMAAVDDGVSVVDHLPDQVAVPCVLVAWGDPWIKPATMCAFTARMELVILAQRIEPGGNLQTLEEITALLVPAIKASHGEFLVDDVTAPYPFQLSGVDYLAASINVTLDMED